jgi:hypothetical protein
MLACCGDAHLSQRLNIGVIEFAQHVDLQNPTKEGIGKERISGECGTMEVGTDDLAVNDAFGTVAITFADFDPAKRGGTGTRNRSSTVVLEPSERAERCHLSAGTGHGGVICEQFADGPGALNTHGDAIEQSEAGLIDAMSIREPFAEDLHSGADCKHNRTCVDCPMQSTTFS